MLEAIAVTKDFGATRALDDVTLRVEPGEIYCLLGANGAGKTTLINLFLHFIDPKTFATSPRSRRASSPRAIDC